MSYGESSRQLVDHLFRHEAGKMIAVLTRIFGIHNLELVEDTVQETFLKALQVWKYQSIPDNPAGWLMQVARNRTIDLIRRQHKMADISEELRHRIQSDTEQVIGEFFLDTEIADSQLRMIFTCCHPALNPEDQIALTLKTVSGFGVSEIAKALVSSEGTIQKRLYRARQYIQEHAIRFEIPAGELLKDRLETVYTVLYLLFNEGYNSSKSDELIRYDLCAEAMRLCKLLSEHQVGNTPSSFALLSLMCFQASRFDSRMGDDNTIILLEHQDRKGWNQDLIRRGYHYLSLSASGNELSVYHIESAIAAEHCLASDFASTNWEAMLKLYDYLLEHKPIPIVQLNRAILLAQLGRLETAIDTILGIPGIDQLLKHHYIYNAVLGDLYGKANNITEARRLLEKAYELTPSLAEKKLLKDKIDHLP
ncbi:MAG: sigma-70 family RNA polymerase sigma factor [Chitinophagaceae bacterium]|nr:sigma-70 family RNA polymerase sigma factor [Chitinophagaceae bacterium]